MAPVRCSDHGGGATWGASVMGLEREFEGRLATIARDLLNSRTSSTRCSGSSMPPPRPRSALRSAQTEEHLRSAIATRTLIGQAQGVLMERLKLTPDQAFAVLSRLSQESNVKLREVARRLVETGEIPGRK